MADVLSNSEHRFCVQYIYIYMNFKKLYRGETLKDLLWKITRSSNEALYAYALKELEEYDKEAHRLLTMTSCSILFLFSYSLSLFVYFVSHRWVVNAPYPRQ